MGTQLFGKRSASALDGRSSASAIALDNYDDDVFILPHRPPKVRRRSPAPWGQQLDYSFPPAAALGVPPDLGFQVLDPEPLRSSRAPAQPTPTFVEAGQSAWDASDFDGETANQIVPEVVYIDERMQRLLDEIDAEADSLSNQQSPQHFKGSQPGDIIDLTDDGDDVIDLTSEASARNHFGGPAHQFLPPGNGYYNQYGYNGYDAGAGRYGAGPSVGYHARVSPISFFGPGATGQLLAQQQVAAHRLGRKMFSNDAEQLQQQYAIPNAGPYYPMRPMPPVITIPDGPNYAEMARQGQIINPREMGGLISKLGVGDEDLLAKMPSAKQPKRIKTELLPYQLQGLAWLLQKEHPQIPTGSAIEQLWAALPSGGYHNIATKLVELDPPKFASGFVLADDMGLGKTIQIISLICADVKTEKELVPVPYVNEKNCDSGTLIIAPVSVMSNWTSQMEQHVDPAHRLSVFVYHGQTRSTVDLGDYEVVITSYGTMSAEFDKGKDMDGAEAAPPKGLFARSWRRIVLDEAHTIRNPKAKCALAACSLRSLSYCSLTGTPIINSLKDLYSLLKFMKYPGGLSEYATFASTMIRGNGTASGPLLQNLVGTLCLRRTKDMKFVDLKLPEFTSRIMPVDLLKSEREKYSLLEQEAKGLLISYQKKKGRDGAETAEVYRNLLEILLRMRQCVNSTQLCGKRLEALKELAGVTMVNVHDPKQQKALQDLLQLAIESGEDCSICLEPLSLNHNPRITACKHVFGLECLQLAVGAQRKCPLCRREIMDLSLSMVGPAEPSPVPDTPPHDSDVPPKKEDDESKDDDDEEEEEEEEEEGEDENGPKASSKIKKLILILKSTRNTDPTRKTVVFSQWTSFLTLIEPHLVKAGITFTRIDGTMKPDQRDAAIATLRGSACSVLLASLSVCSVGLNLTMASQCILCDSWWAGAIEQQAIDRVYRLGQKRDVDVFRLVVQDSIEKRVLEIQDRKAKLIEDAFQEGGRRQKRERGRGLQDIQQLLS